MEQEWQMVDAGMVVTWGFTILPLTFVKINGKVFVHNVSFLSGKS